MSSWVAWGACGPESTTAHDRASRRETRIWRYPYPALASTAQKCARAPKPSFHTAEIYSMESVAIERVSVFVYNTFTHYFTPRISESFPTPVSVPESKRTTRVEASEADSRQCPQRASLPQSPS
jgi:hypothetical protein